MIDVFICYIHVFSSLVLSLYFLWRTEFFDKFYILYFLLLNLSWIVLKDECFISYIFKKTQNSEYKLGDSPDDTQEYESVLGPVWGKIFVNFLRVMYILNISYIIYNKSLNTILSILVSLCAFSYIFYIKLFQDKKTRDPAHIREVHAVLTIIPLVYMVSKFK